MDDINCYVLSGYRHRIAMAKRDTNPFKHTENEQWWFRGWDLADKDLKQIYNPNIPDSYRSI